MWLEVIGGRLIEGVTEGQLREAITSLTGADANSVAILTDADSNYVQVAGGNRPWLVLERRVQRPLYHMRAYREMAHEAAGELRGTVASTPIGPDEWLDREEAFETMRAFLTDGPYPPHIRWRSMNEVMGL